MLGFDANLDPGCRFSEHLLSLREVEGLQYCSKTLKIVIYKSLRLPFVLEVDHGVVVMTVGSWSGDS